MNDGSPAVDIKLNRRVQAVLALFRGASVERSSARFGICHSDLYKFRPRAYAAIHAALAAAYRSKITARVPGGRGRRSAFLL